MYFIQLVKEISCTEYLATEIHLQYTGIGKSDNYLDNTEGEKKLLGLMRNMFWLQCLLISNYYLPLFIPGKIFNFIIP